MTEQILSEEEFEVLSESIKSFINYKPKEKTKGYDISIINAVFDLRKDGDLRKTAFKLEVLDRFLNLKIGQDSLNTYKRIKNMLGSKTLDGKVNIDYLESDLEWKLYVLVGNTLRELDIKLADNKIVEAFVTIAMLNPVIKKYLDTVFINDPDPKVANNRKLLLQGIKRLFEKIAKFDELCK